MALRWSQIYQGFMNNKLKSIVRPFVVSTFLVVATSTANAAARAPTHVACVGDSITAGVGASSSNTNYPAALQTLFGSSVKVMNFGHSGATMLSVGDLPYQQQSEYTAATSFVSGAGVSAVVDVILMLGTNDSKPYNWTVGTATRAEQFRKDCAAMVDHFTQLSTHPLVYLALPPHAYTNTYQISGTVLHDEILPVLKQVAADKGIPVIDVDTPTTGHPELFPDGVHPNDNGYRIVAQVMHDGLLAPVDNGDAGDGGATGSGGDVGGAGGAGGRDAGGAAGPTGGSSGGTGGTSGSGGASVAGQGGNPVGGTGAGGLGGGAGAQGGSVANAAGGFSSAGTFGSGGSASVSSGGVGGNGSGGAGSGGSVGKTSSGTAAAGGASGGSSTATSSSGCSCNVGHSCEPESLGRCVFIGILSCFFLVRRRPRKEMRDDL